MFRQLFEQIAATLSQPDRVPAAAEQRERAIRRATAVLMLDVALADKVFDEREVAHLRAIAQEHFGLEPAEADELIASAREEAEQMVSLHEFTHFLHNNLSHDEKARIVGLLWRIAYTDGELDKYENSLVLKISDLLYVSRARVMRLKFDAAEAAGSSS